MVEVESWGGQIQCHLFSHATWKISRVLLPAPGGPDEHILPLYKIYGRVEKLRATLGEMLVSENLVQKKQGYQCDWIADLYYGD